MRELRIYWRPATVTDDRLEGLRAVLTDFPGQDDVIVHLRDQRVRLGVKVDSTAPGLRRAAALAIVPECVLAVDTTDAF